jgi:hypothetical protein
MPCSFNGFDKCVSERYSRGYGLENTLAVIPALIVCFEEYAAHLKLIPQTPPAEIPFEDQRIEILPVPVVNINGSAVTLDYSDRLAYIRERLLTAEHITPGEVPGFGFRSLDEQKVAVIENIIPAKPAQKDMTNYLKLVKDKKAQLAAKKKEKVKI